MFNLTRILAGIVCLSFFIAGAMAFGADVLAQLGLTETEARDRALQGIDQYTPPIGKHARRTLREASPQVRAALTTAGLGWLKAYTESSDFRGRYETLRERRKPHAPKSAAEQIQEEQAKQRKNIEELKKNMSKTDPRIRKDMEKMVKQSEAQLNDPKQQALLKQVYGEEAAKEEKRYQKKVEEWEKFYPADPRRAIAKRLRDFLDVSAKVDYNAKLTKPVGRQGTVKFADRNLEEKPEEWKLCYRAGKPAVDAARSFAAAWLPELEKK
jgi:hypothetical protein